MIRHPWMREGNESVHIDSLNQSFEANPPQTSRSSEVRPTVCIVLINSENSPHPETGTFAAGEQIERWITWDWDVHLLDCNEQKNLVAVPSTLQQSGRWITLHALAELVISPPFDSPSGTIGCGDNLTRSNTIRLALQALCDRYPIRVIEFPSQGIPAFRTIQAKRAGLTFDEVTLRVIQKEPAISERERRKQLGSPQESIDDYCERYCFENADRVWCISKAVEATCFRLGWKAPGELERAEHWYLPRTTEPEHEGKTLTGKEFVKVPIHPSQSSRIAKPAVTIGVSYYNLGKYLPETLASLARQSFQDLEVIVIDDGSTCPLSREVWEQERRKYPSPFRFLTQSNAGPGAARNHALEEARGEYFIPVDADNLATPGMVERFVRAMRNNPHLAAMTSFFLAFRETPDIAQSRFEYQVTPIGGPHLAACVHNVYGDTNAIFRTKVLRAVGGFETDPTTYCEDWETFVKLVKAGYQLDVIPEFLFYYRRRSDSRSAQLTQQGTDLYPFLRRMMPLYFSTPGQEFDEESHLLWTALTHYFATLNPAMRDSLLPEHAFPDRKQGPHRPPRTIGSLLKWLMQSVEKALKTLGKSFSGSQGFPQLTRSQQTPRSTRLDTFSSPR